MNEEVEQLRRVVASLTTEKAILNPEQSIVFEFSPEVAPGKAFAQDRKQFEDGRYRVFLHTRWEPVVALWTSP